LWLQFKEEGILRSKPGPVLSASCPQVLPHTCWGRWMHVPCPAASALLGRSKCQAPHAAEECLPALPASSSRTGWQAKDKSSPATALTACC